MKASELETLKVESLFLRGKPYAGAGGAAGALARGLFPARLLEGAMRQLEELDQQRLARGIVLAGIVIADHD